MRTLLPFPPLASMAASGFAHSDYGLAKLLLDALINEWTVASYLSFYPE